MKKNIKKITSKLHSTNLKVWIITLIFLVTSLQGSIIDIFAEETQGFVADTSTVEETQGVQVYINNEEIPFNDEMGYPFIDENNRTQVPFRIVLEYFGAKVTYNEEKRIAIAQKGDVTVRVPIGEKFIYKNEEIIINDTEAVIIDDRTYLPIRAVMEAFGCHVNWIDNEKRVDVDYNDEVSLIGSIPGYYDLRNAYRVTSIKNQGDLGTCWAFAAIAAMESTALPGEEVNFSEDHMSLTHGYQIPQSGGGDYSVAMSYLARWSGPVLEESDPYGDGIAVEDAEAVVHIQESMMLPYKDYDAIKISIMDYGGVQSGIYLDPNINEEDNMYYNEETSAYYYNGTNERNHDILIIGWDNTYPKENFEIVPEHDGAFICKNSYGSEFGEDGYIYISYDDIKIGTKNIVYSRVDDYGYYDNIYQTDWLGWVGRLGYGSDTAYFSNVYETKEEAELLEAVSFYATDIDTAYEIYLVKDFESTEDFKDMKFYKRGRFNYAGYYTVDFDEPIMVEGKFAVVVKVITPGSSLPVAAEYYKDVYWLDEVNINDGEGYMSTDAKAWDRTEEILSGNVSLKAFTSSINLEEIDNE